MLRNWRKTFGKWLKNCQKQGENLRKSAKIFGNQIDPIVLEIGQNFRKSVQNVRKLAQNSHKWLQSYFSSQPTIYGNRPKLCGIQLAQNFQKLSKFREIGPTFLKSTLPKILRCWPITVVEVGP